LGITLRNHSTVLLITRLVVNTKYGASFLALGSITKIFIMDKMEKKNLMDKMIRELEDISNSQTSLLKKITQLEADNINLGNSLLDKRLPDIHEKIDAGLTEVTDVSASFTELRDQFVKDNKLEEVLESAN
jgi:ElaB/YqjD/DUF883 family membrane-anchored ribosome-binding protein